MINSLSLFPLNFVLFVQYSNFYTPTKPLRFAYVQTE